MVCATHHAAPPYPTVVAVKLSTINAPNGVAGFCGRSGLSASARNPDGLPSEPMLIATTIALGGVIRRCSNTRKKTNRSPVIISALPDDIADTFKKPGRCVQSSPSVLSLLFDHTAAI